MPRAPRGTLAGQLALERSLTTVARPRGERGSSPSRRWPELDDLLQGLRSSSRARRGGPVRLTSPGAGTGEADDRRRRARTGCPLTTSRGRGLLSVAEVWGRGVRAAPRVRRRASRIDEGKPGHVPTSANELRTTREAVDAAIGTARDDPLGLLDAVRVADARGPGRPARRGARGGAPRASDGRTHELRGLAA